MIHKLPDWTYPFGSAEEDWAKHGDFYPPYLIWRAIHHLFGGMCVMIALPWWGVFFLAGFITVYEFTSDHNAKSFIDWATWTAGGVAGIFVPWWVVLVYGGVCLAGLISNLIVKRWCGRGSPTE